MPTYSRSQGQRILVGEPPDQIIIAVKRIRGTRVLLSVTAPRKIKINREEVALARAEQAKGASDA